MNKPVVAIEVDTKTDTVIIWTQDGEIIKEPLVPWHVGVARGVQAKKIKLSGASGLNFLYLYGSYENYKIGLNKFPYTMIYNQSDLVQQFLILNPKYKLFQDMVYTDLKRFIFDIETTGLNFENDSITRIGVRCSLGEFVLKGTEPEIIRAINKLVQIDNPDTIEGFNIYNFDIPFLITRAKQYGLELNWGRTGEAVEEGRELAYRIGSFSRPVSTHNCFGRHFVDGLLIAQRYDSINGNSFESFGLKYLEEKFGIASPDRVIVDRTRITEYDDDTLDRYVLDDVRGTEKLIEIMVQPEYYLSSIIPAKFQDILLMGGATRINLVLIDKYIQERHSIPIYQQQTNTGYQGGQVEVKDVGVFHNVAKIDVASLYPSIMLNTDGIPARDSLGAFRSTLKELTDKRFEYKRKAKTLSGQERIRYNGMQMALKIFINSYYGYLASGMTFSDQEAAAKVTEIGRSIVNDMAEQVTALGHYVIEVDTDGIYFQYMPELKDSIKDLPKQLNLKPWITVEVESFFDSMLSIKMKNYVLKKDGKIIYHGNSIRSRRDEGFGKLFLKEIIELLFDDRFLDIIEVYKHYQTMILNQSFEPQLLAKRERITNKVFESNMKRRLLEAVKQTDLVEGDYIEIYQNNKGEYAPISQINYDEDIFYYLSRLYQFAKRLEPVFVKYNIEIPKITKREYKGLVNR